MYFDTFEITIYNIKNISMDGKYAAVCGITKEELLSQMSPDIDYLATHKQHHRRHKACLVNNDVSSTHLRLKNGPWNHLPRHK